jgi:AcrR family transcriptional regulator
MVAAVDDRGVESASVTRVISLAGVSRTTFYALFGGRNDCLLAAIEQTVTVASERVEQAYAAQDAWPTRIRAALSGLLELFDHQPQLARLCVVHSATTADPKTVKCRLRVLEQLAEAIDAGREEARHTPPPLTAEAVVAGALGVIHARLVERTSESLTDLLNPLMSFIVRPYRGGGAARRELQKARPATHAPRSRNRTPDPLAPANVRMTYRTMRVLAAIGANPGLNNAEASEHAGIKDQGQISKLLGRLQRLGLVANTGEGQSSGRPNAWRLTPRGQRLKRPIHRELLKSTR